MELFAKAIAPVDWVTLLVNAVVKLPPIWTELEKVILASVSNVPPLMVSRPDPRARVSPSFKVPAERVVPPVNVFPSDVGLLVELYGKGLRYNVPAPLIVMDDVPEMFAVMVAMPEERVADIVELPTLNDEFVDRLDIVEAPATVIDGRLKVVAVRFRLSVPPFIVTAPEPRALALSKLSTPLLRVVPPA